MTKTLARAAGDRRHQQDFISILKRVRLPAQKADIFFVHIHVEETANLAGFIAQVRLKIGELLIERGKQFSQIRRRASDSRITCCQPAQGRRNLNCNSHLGPHGLGQIFFGTCCFRSVQRPFHVFLEFGELRRDGLFEFVLARQRIGGFQTVAGDAQNGGFVG